MSLTSATRKREFVTYESDRYIDGPSPAVVPGYKVTRIYSITNKGTYVRHVLQHLVTEKVHGYTWQLTLVDPVTRFPGARHIKRRVPKRMGF